MKNILMHSFSILLSGAIVIFATAFAVEAQSNQFVTAGSAGAVRIGMTLSDARDAMPGFTFERTSDGEGIALIAVKKGENEILSLCAGEEDSEAAIDFSKVIEQIEVWDSSYKTKEGVGPDTTILEASSKYGAVKEIMVSEIESRQYVEFVNNPKGITFRIDYSGIFKDGERTTTQYNTGAKMMSIIIQGDGSESNVGFYSDYTDLETECKTPEGEGEEGGHVSTYCEGRDDYRIHIYDTAMTLEITVESTVSRDRISVARESLDFTTKGKKLEWRYKNGVPFAVILRVNGYELNEDGHIKYPSVSTGEFLSVRGLPGFEAIHADVNVAATRFANEEARKIADEGYVNVKFPQKDYMVVDTSDYNLMIVTAANKGETWVKSPMQVAARLAGEFEEIKTRQMNFEANSAESPDSVIVTVTNDGLLDDSVRGDKWIFELIKETNGDWKVSSIKKSWRCWPGRGHEDFSAEPCI